MTLEELLADSKRRGKVCGFINRRPVYHGDKLIPVDPLGEQAVKESNPLGFLFAFYSFEYTPDRLRDYVTTRIPGYHYIHDEDDHPFFNQDLVKAKLSIENDPEYEGLFI